MKREIEWDNDYLNIGFSTSSDSFVGETFSDHEYQWIDRFIPLALNELGNFSFNFVSDASLDYRC